MQGSFDSVSIENRKQQWLDLLAREDLSEDVTGGTALINLGAGRFLSGANSKLQAAAQWYVLPHPKGRDPYGECDFVAIKLAWAYYRFKDTGVLEAKTLESIRAYFLTYDFQSKYTSENHQLLFHTSRYLMANAYPDEIFGRYGAIGRDLAALERAWLCRFLRFHAACGWDEFDSGSYIAPAWECLCALYDFAPDADVQGLAHMMLDVRLMDFLEDSLEGMHCGAHGRIYERHALDHRAECTYFLYALYFGGIAGPCPSTITEALLSSYQPDPVLGKIAGGRIFPYESRERAPLHYSTYLAPQRPLPQGPGSIRKLTRIEETFALGAVQWQDSYPQGSLAAWRTGHQQHEWDLTFAGGDTRRKIFTHHPGHNGAEGAEHGYWTGDLFCNCGCHFQHETAVLALHDIPLEEPYGFIHAYLPKDLFDQVEERGNSIYVQYRDTYAMLRFARPYRWVEEGPYGGAEVICEGRVNGAACQVGTAEGFGSFEGFVQAMEESRLLLDEGKKTLTYTSVQVGEMVLSRDRRLLNGKPVDLAYATYDSPYMHGGWEAGVVRIQYGNETLVNDFQRIERTRILG